MWRPPRRLAALCMGAFLSVGCISGGGPAGTPPHGSPALGTIVALRAEQATTWHPSGRNWSVTLTWASSPGSATVHYEVLRDGVPLAKDLAEPAYRDPQVDPGVTYAYAVFGANAEGGRTAPAFVRVRTHAPSLPSARLEGSFLVSLRATSSSGLRRQPRSRRLLFRYEPRCGEVTCPVRWSVRARPARAMLARSGAGYRGATRGPFLMRSCNGEPIAGHLALSTRVVAAGPVDRVWRATRIRGVVLETAAVPGCRPARIRWRFEGVIQT